MMCSMALSSPVQVSLAQVQVCRTRTTARVVHSGAKLRVRAPMLVMASSLSQSSAEEEGPGAQTEPPRLDDFSQSRLSRSMRDRTILQKAESALYDKCMALEGEKAYECWEALFDYEHIKEEYETECDVAPSENRAEACRPLERFENMVRQSGGANSLIDNVRMSAKVAKRNAAAAEKAKSDAPNETSTHHHHHDTRTPEQINAEEHERHEDGGIPKTLEEMDHEKDGLMPESDYTRILRRRGKKSTAWFTQPPEHETD
ncbi:hypothetical protein MPTK1_6g17450 [Marchantia polymorpha subsp. ruderalis]|uniref:Uncharacterized protein n=2 Tax=Marchantia polymorpha TaxID=3197 RepID=A0A176WJA8_MARPO|nr:hypothetical protein AXG93_107s1260 [Marchantia polymorpha subsp. ruderalis]PTQ27762.1 hypothetical protein MARPO_0184s0005 [Marchantia polymorpha]BBN15150.1 hypothetical protein Mp_6g17450 [Marchantia polymorpha subsp. ruderalis]|eukprot:PTQ27762.1 hypothetical protein MARPO_0184s0005 [Marchantia polymorpha]